MGDKHAPFDAPQDGIAFVVGEIYPARLFENHINMGKDILVREVMRTFLRDRNRGIIGKTQDFLGQLAGGQNNIRQSCVDGAAGHTVELGAFRVLEKMTARAHSSRSSAREAKKISMG